MFVCLNLSKDSYIRQSRKLKRVDQLKINHRDQISKIYKEVKTTHANLKSIRTTDGIVNNYSEAATDFPFHLTKSKTDADPHAVCY